MTRVAFVAGATGYTGRAVVARLLEEGFTAVAHVRPDSPRLEEERARFAAAGATVDVTPWDEEAITATLARLRPAVVFALLGTTRASRKRDHSTYETVDYGLTALLLRAARACGASPRFVYLGAAAAREGTRNPYLEVRVRIERELAASGLPWYSARPVFVTGADREDDRPAERITAGVLDGALALAGALGARGLRDRWRSMDAATLARGLVRLATDARPGRAVEAGELRAG
jgi:nucleoside-diphosphate-sugar epimerase